MKQLIPSKASISSDVEERTQRDAKIDAKIRRKEQWKKSRYRKWILEIIDEEIEKANNNSAIPENLSREDRGDYSLALLIAYARLQAIRKKL